MAFSAVTSHEYLLLILCTASDRTGAGISKQTVALVMLSIPGKDSLLSFQACDQNLRVNDKPAGYAC